MRKNVLWVILGSIFVVLFNVFFFVLGGTKHNASVWVSYGFIHFAYLLVLMTPIFTRKTKSSFIFGMTTLKISTIYFTVEFFIGLIFIVVSPEKSTATILIQILIAGLYGAVLISNLLANEYTTDAEKKHQVERAYIKDASVKLKIILDNVKEKGIKHTVESVYDAVYSSPVKSHPDLMQIEERILQSIEELERAASTENKEHIISITDSLLNDIKERNTQLKTLH